MANQWCRLYRETITDPKLSRLSASQRHIWTVLMCLAIDGDGAAEIADGVGYTSDEIAALAGAEVDETRAALEWFERVGMISTDEAGVIVLVNWEQRQFKSDSSSERTRHYRDRVKRHRDVTVTECDATAVTDQNRDRTDTDTDTEQKKSARKRAPRPPFVQPSLDEVRSYCRERNKGVDPERWLAHYESNGWKVGRNPMKDWRAAVRTWEGSDIGKSAAKRPDPGRHVDASPWHADDVATHSGHPQWDSYLDHMAGRPAPWPRFLDWLATQEGK